MFNSETLEIGIGMAFLFLLMSLICTGIQEWLEGIFKWRAMDLERAVRTLLDDDKGQLTAHLLAHPVLSSLYQGRYDPERLTDSTATSWMTGGANAKHMALSARRHLPSYIPAAHFAKALIDLIGRGPAGTDGESSPAAPLTVALLRERAAALHSPYLRRAVLTAIDHSGNDLHRLTENLQSWFDGSMDRASGWYKRRAQSVLFVLGIGAAAALNVDALYVMGRLTADQTFREAVVTAAAHAHAPASAAGGAPVLALAPAPTPAPAPAAAAASATASAPGPARRTDAMQAAIDAREELERVGMPIGWSEVVDTKASARSEMATRTVPVQMCKLVPREKGGCEVTDVSYVRIVVGWLITAFAVMLGAPFWFDVLNKFMVIRSTVKPHEKSQEEGSEDRQNAKVQSAATAVAPIPAASPAATDAAAAGPPPAPADEPFVPHAWRPGNANPKEISL